MILFLGSRSIYPESDILIFICRLRPGRRGWVLFAARYFGHSERWYVISLISPQETSPVKGISVWNARLLFCIGHNYSSWQNNWSNAEVSNLERYLGSEVCNNSSNHLQKALHAFRGCVFLQASCLGWPVSGHQSGATLMLLRKKQTTLFLVKWEVFGKIS